MIARIRNRPGRQAFFCWLPFANRRTAMTGDDRKPAPPDTRSRQEVEADEAAALRQSADTARKDVAETGGEPVEPPEAMEVQGDLPGLDDNSRQDSAPSWDAARKIADTRPVGA